MKIIYLLVSLSISLLLLPGACSTSSNFVVKSNEIIELYGTLDCLWHRVYSEDTVKARATILITDNENQSHMQVILYNFTLPERTWSFLFCADSEDNIGKYGIASARVVWEKLE